MGIFEKLKNALFEEEYVEVVEKPKTKKVSKKKPVSKEVVKEKHDEDYEDEKPVAKKVVLPEKKEPVIPENIDLDEDFEDEEPEFYIPIFINKPSLESSITTVKHAQLSE